MDRHKPTPRLVRQDASTEKELGDLWTKAKTRYHEEFKDDFTQLKQEAIANAKTSKPLTYERRLEDIHRKVISNVLQFLEAEEGLQVEQRRKLRTSLDFQREKYRDELRLHMNATARPAIGIDLGTTYCCVAACINGQVTVIPNEIGKNTTPSYVCIDEAYSFIGQPAKDQAHAQPEKTIFDAKRLIGRTFNDPNVQEDMKLWPFKVVNEKLHPKIMVDSRTYHPDEISALLLKSLKKQAEDHIGETIRDAVITVPAYFNNGQRQATKKAGKLAGLNVLQIINEPTAAAITYNLHRVEKSARNVLIFDLGGGTFDVSVLTIHDGDIKIRAVNGDTHLGGEDFDSALVQYCIDAFRKQHGLDAFQGKDSFDKEEKFQASKRLRRLRNECEKQKISLSSARKVRIEIDSFMDGKDLQVPITREQFEKLIYEQLMQSLEIVDMAIADASLEKQDIDDIVLVGGSSRIPKVQQLLTDYFKGKPLFKSINADEAIAHGAAIQACLINEGDDNQLQFFTNISDVIPLSLGVQVRDGDFSVMIPRNTPIPFEMTRTYVTRYDNQTAMKFPIYEGEEKKVKNNHFLGEIMMENIQAGKAGVGRCDLLMRVDTNGIFKVEATMQDDTENQKAIQISLSQNQPKYDVDELIQDFEDGITSGIF